MKAVMLAAGIGERLDGPDEHPPKVLLRFGGKSLLRRHVEILRHFGFDELVLGVGYRAGLIAEEIAAIGAGDFVRTSFNPDYERGPIVTLWSLRAELRDGGPVVLMDGDVLYDHRLMARLVAAAAANCFLLDREVGEGDDPVRICLRRGRIVDLHKRPRAAADECGEWVGFVRLAADVAERVATATERYVEAGRTDVIYEEALRDQVVGLPPGTFGYEDVTGLPWIEIDFPEDLRRAREVVLPRLEDLPM